MTAWCNAPRISWRAPATAISLISTAAWRAWEKAGFVTFSGVHVPSKAFGEFVEHDSGTPSISATELDALMRSMAPSLRCSTAVRSTNTRASRFRPASTCPAPSWSCACTTSRPRPTPPSSSIAPAAPAASSARSRLINAGVPNKVMALRNGTMGWHLAGLTCASGETGGTPGYTDEGLAWAKAPRRNGGEEIRRRHAPTPPTVETMAQGRHAHHLRLRRARAGGIRSRPLSRRHLRARRATGAGDRHLCRRAGCARRGQRRQGSSRADDRLLAQADGLAGGLRAAASRRRERPAGAGAARHAVAAMRSSPPPPSPSTT